MDAEQYFEESFDYLQRFKNQTQAKSVFLQVQRLIWEKSFFPSRFPVGSIFLCSNCNSKKRDISFCLQCGRCYCGTHFSNHSCKIPSFGVDILTQQLFIYIPKKGRRFIFDAYLDHLILSAKLAVVDGLPLTTELEQMSSIFPIKRQPYPLFNLGNTCWLNSMLQCFAVNPYLQKWFLSQTINVKKIECPEEAIHMHLYKWFLANIGDGNFSISDFVFAIWTGFPSFANQQQNDAHEFWMQFRSKLDDYYQNKFDTTIFNQIFSWKFTVFEVCEKCGFTKSYFENATDLILFSPDSKSISELIPEYLSSNIPGTCGCTANECKKHMYFITLPPVLTIALTRARSNGPATKIEETLDLSNFIDSLQKDEISSTKYSLNSMVVRPGSGDKGHYWANVCKWGQWYRCDDFTITPIAMDDALKDDGCLLFYTRNGFIQ